MPLGIGAYGKAGIIKESSYGDGGQATTFLEIRAEDSVKNEITKIQGDFLTGSPNLFKYYHGIQDPKGGIPIVVNPDNVGLLLFLALGAEASPDQVVGTVAEITNFTCEADSSGSLSGEYILVSSPSTDYYVWFDVTGMGSADPAISGRTGIIVTIDVDDNADTVAIAMGVALDDSNIDEFQVAVNSAVVTVINDSTGAVTVPTNGDTEWSTSPDITTAGAGGTAYDHIFTPAGSDTDLKSFSYNVERDIHSFIYSGCVVNSMSFKASKGSLLFADFDIIAKSEDDTATFPADISASTKRPYTFHMGVVKVDGSAVAYVNSFDMIHSFNLDVEGFVMDGADTRAHAYKTTENLSGSLEMEWTSASDTFRDAYLDNTQMKLELIFTSPEEIESGYYYTLTIEIPVVHILGDPPVLSSRERIPFSINWEATFDSTNFIKITHRDARTTKWSS